MLEPNRNRARAEKGTLGGRTGLEKKLIILSIICAIIAATFLILYFLRPSCSADLDECTTRDCVEASAEILEYIYPKADPCRNFYYFTCGNFIKNAVKIATPTPLNIISDLFENEMKSIVVDPIYRDSHMNLLLKQFYQGCMNEDKIDKDDNEAFIKEIDKIGGWPLINGSNWNEKDFNWVNMHINLTTMGLPFYGFFTFSIANTDSNDTVLQINGVKLGDSLSLTSLKYLKLMKNVAEAFDANHESHTIEIKNVHSFIKKLKSIEYDSYYDDWDTVSDISELYKQCPQVPWLEYLNSISSGYKYTNETEVAFNLREYCKALNDLLNQTSKRTQNNYLIWGIIDKMRHYLSRDIRNAYENYADENEDRFKLCLADIDTKFKYVKETIYVRRKTGDKETREQLNEMIELLKESFARLLANGDWMDETTKKAAVEKIQLVENVIGSDEELYEDDFEKILAVDNFHFSSDNIFTMAQERYLKLTTNFFEAMYKPKAKNWPSFFKNALEVNAFFVQALNVMILPAPILQHIFFNPLFPKYMNYGGIGRVIGHELMHGFEESAREVLLENDEMLDWWTNDTLLAYKKKVQCVVNDYEEVPFKYKLNGTQTLEENVSDYVGIDAAYEAYQRWVEKHGKEKKLPGLPYTPEQIFWIQSGMLWCFRKLDDDATDYEEPDEHSIPFFRVNAPSRNSKYFAKDFNCPVGSYMNPEKKCQVL